VGQGGGKGGSEGNHEKLAIGAVKNPSDQELLDRGSRKKKKTPRQFETKTSGGFPGGGQKGTFPRVKRGKKEKKMESPNAVGSEESNTRKGKKRSRLG